MAYNKGYIHTGVPQINHGYMRNREGYRGYNSESNTFLLEYGSINNREPIVREFTSNGPFTTKGFIHGLIFTKCLNYR